MICKVVINNEEIDVEELLSVLRTGDKAKLTSLIGEVSPLLEKMRLRYGVDSHEESIMEMIANFRVGETGLSRDEVEAAIYPKGSVHDYRIQQQIHENTRSGGRLTGIAANSTKTIASVHEATPITKISYKGNEYSIKRDDKTVDNSEIKFLLDKYQVNDVDTLVSEVPSVKVIERQAPMISNGITINGVEFNFFSRFERDINTGEKKISPNSGLPINIFETTDTITNLAIDNVKEQKLFVIGITASNANVYVSMLALGIPFREVAKIFNLPLVKQISTGNRLEANGDRIDQLKSKSFSKHLSTSMLDKVLSGQATVEETNEVNFHVLQMIEKLRPLGQELFGFAQTLSLLRRMPSEMSGAVSKAELATQYSNFSAYTSKDETVESARNVASEVLSQTDEVLDSADPEATLKDLTDRLNASATFDEFTSEIARRAFSNAVSRGTFSRELVPSSESSFSNVSLLRLPHLLEAWKTLSAYKKLIESTFVVHSPLIRAQAEMMIKRLGIRTFGNQFQVKVNHIATEFLRYLTSNVELTIGEDKITFNERDRFETINNRVYYGVDAWAQKLVSDIKELKNKYQDNEFMNAIGFRTDRETLETSMELSADKVGDFKILQIIKDDFAKLVGSADPAERRIALDVFKYALITKGLLYDKTSFALIFPATYYAAFSAEFEARIQRMVSTNTLKAISNLTNAFTHFQMQYIRNNPNDIDYVQGVKPEEVKSTAKRKQYSGRTKEFNYSLKFPIKEGVIYPNYIRRYGNEIYAKKEVSGDNFVYYRLITGKNNNSYYDFSSEDATTVFVINPLINVSILLDGRNVSTTRLESIVTYTEPNIKTEYEVGELVYIASVGNPRFKSMKRGTILKKEERTDKGQNYSIRIDDNNIRLVLGSPFREFDALITDKYNSNARETETPADAVISAKRDSAIAIVSKPLRGGVTLPKDKEEALAFIKGLDRDTLYYIDRNVVKDQELAEAFRDAIGYYAPILNVDSVIFKETEERAQFSSTFAFIQKSLGDREVTKEEITKLGGDGFLHIMMRDKRRFTRIKEGDLVRVGMYSGVPALIYVEAITDTEIIASKISPEMLPFLSKNNYPKEEYEQIINEHKTC